VVNPVRRPAGAFPGLTLSISPRGTRRFIVVGALWAPSNCPHYLCGGHPHTPVPGPPLRASLATYGADGGAKDTVSEDYARRRGPLGHAATMFTSFGGRTTTRVISCPASARITPGAVTAMSRSWASVMSGETSSRSRTLPFT